MRLRAWGFCGGVAFLLSACSGSQDVGTSSSSGGTTGHGTTGHATTGHHTVGGIGTGSATTSSGSSTGGVTSSGTSTGGTTAGTTSSSSGGTETTTGGTSNGGTSGGTTGYVPSPAYQGYDAGPRNEPNIQTGCTAATPFTNPGGQFAYPPCVQCLKTADCATGLFCSSNYQCVGCRNAKDCAAGDICQDACYYLNGPPYIFPCLTQCQPDCRDAGADFCNPGLCDTDAGGCLPYQCTANSQCVVNGQGACNFDVFAVEQFPQGGNFLCAQCTADAGGCGQDQFCSQGVCQPSCLLDAGICTGGTYCTDAGTCANGCQSSADCANSYNGTICHQGQCVACLNDAQCPPNNLACGQTMYNGVQCGICGSDLNCPAGLHCENLNNYNGNGCGCHSDDECASSSVGLSVPVCVGLNANLGFPAGSGKCGCRSAADCSTGEICETRYPYTVSVNNSAGAYTGGTCIPSCSVVGGTDCSTAGIQPSQYYYGNGYAQIDNVCNFQSGYCVSCAQDSDCSGPYDSATGPAITPACVLFSTGTDPTSGLPTGGGNCACSDTSQCNDGYACWDPGLNGACQPPCTVVNGVDSCFPQTYYQSTAPADPFCNTETGSCVQCLDSWGCTNLTTYYINGNYVGVKFPASTCSPGGQCYGCNSSADCPAEQPNCTDGYCGFCMQNSDCDTSSYQFQCIDFYTYNGNVGGDCLVKCVDYGDGTPSDAGNACPPNRPYCSTTYIYTNNGETMFSICAACRPNYYPSDCGNYPNYCMQNGICGSYY